MSNPVIENLVDSLKATKLELENQLADINKMLAFYTGDSSHRPIQQVEGNSKNGKNGYDASWSHSQKFIYLLKRENRFLHFREVAEMVVELEGGDVKQVVDKMTSGTGFLRKNGSIVKIQPTNMLRDTFWGSPKWLDENGKVIPGHEFNPDYLYNSGKLKESLEI